MKIGSNWKIATRTCNFIGPKNCSSSTRKSIPCQPPCRELSKIIKKTSQRWKPDELKPLQALNVAA